MKTNSRAASGLFARSSTQSFARSFMGLLTLILLTLPQFAFGWGPRAHNLSAQIAEQYLTPSAQVQINALLKPGESLRSIATWGDQYSSQHKYARPWQYVNVPITESNYQSKYCLKSECIVAKIHAFQAVLRDPSASKEQKTFALKFLVHLIQDLHQPLHVGDNHDRGGNQHPVVLKGETTNLHRVWDSGLMHFADLSNRQWLQRLDAQLTPENQQLWQKGSIEDWATESLKLARQAYRLPGENTVMRENASLDDRYINAYLPWMTQRLAQASIRIATVLNSTWPS